jgi:hypothetical protein
MRCRSASFVLVLFAVLLPFLCIDTAHAIPAFSRQHKTECTTCHTIYPELNEYGEAFLKNGYVYMGKPSELKKAGKDTKGGEAEGQKDMKNEGLWLSGIPEMVPVSLTASFDLAYDEHAANGDKLDISTRSLVLSAGGALRDKAGFFLNYNLYTQGAFDPRVSNVPGNNSPNIGELFLVWRHALDTPINLKVGRFRPKLSLWKTSNKLTVASMAPSAYKVGSSQFAVDATEDGLEANSIVASRLFLAGGVVNRKGQNTKEGYGHVSFKLGGADYLGNEPEVDLESDSIWDFLTVTTGLYSYFGRNADQLNGIAQNFNNYYRAGADLDILYKRLRVKLSGVQGKDTNPGFLAANVAEIRSMVLASEADYMFDTDLIALFRYEYQDDGTAITRRYIPMIAYAPIQNTKLTLEYKYEGVANYSAPSAINRIVLLGVEFSL